MFLLPELAFYVKAFSDFSYFNKSHLDIAFNNDNNFVINKNIIDYVENSLTEENKDYFGTFLRELYDSNRFENCTSIDINNYKNSCLSFYTGSNKSLLIPIKTEENSEFTKTEFPNLLDINSSEEFDKILKTLLMKSHIQICYQDFASNENINEYMSNIFSIPKHVDEVYFFNRDISDRFLKNFRSKKINYYTLIKKPIRNYLNEYRDTKNEFRRTISGRFKLYTIANNTLIHERKIFINNLCISFDNAFENIRIEEPTWEISISYSNDKFLNWKQKIDQFHAVG